MVWYGAVAAAIALLTPVVRTAAIVDALPLWFQWYMKPAGDLTAFTLFPWAGFVFAGAACGVILATTDSPQAERRVQFAFAVAGARVSSRWVNTRRGVPAFTSRPSSGPVRRRGSRFEPAF